MSDSVSIPFKKMSARMTISESMVRQQQLDRFPRRSHTVEHPPTDEEKAEYKVFARDKAARVRFVPAEPQTITALSNRRTTA